MLTSNAPSTNFIQIILLVVSGLLVLCTAHVAYIPQNRFSHMQCMRKYTMECIGKNLWKNGLDFIVVMAVSLWYFLRFIFIYSFRLVTLF